MNQGVKRSLKKSTVRVFTEMPRFVYITEILMIIDGICALDQTPWLLPVVIGVNSLTWAIMILYDYMRSLENKSEDEGEKNKKAKVTHSWQML